MIDISTEETLKLNMSITEQRVTLRIVPETDTEAAFLRVLCHQDDVDDIREQMNACRWETNPARREIVAEAFWTSHLGYNLDKVDSIEITHSRAKREASNK